MPKDFTDCVKRGGSVRTIKPRGTEDPLYLHICYDYYDKTGKRSSKRVSHRGEVKYRKDSSAKRSTKRSNKHSTKRSNKRSTKRSTKRTTKRTTKKSMKKGRKC